MIKQYLRCYSFSTKVLTRDFIYDRLYHKQAGYFTDQNKLQLGSLKKPIDFKNLIGYEDYTKQLAENYPQNKWLTPSEIFRPYYGITIGNYISQQFNYIQQQNQQIKKLRILEVGAGYGAACEGVLYFLRNYCPKLYSSDLEYHIVELSSAACQGSQQRLEQEFGQFIKKGRLRIFNDDFLKFSISPAKDEIWFILFLEVFDNLPHDKIIQFQNQTIVDQETKQESYEVINDPLIRETLKLYQKFLEDNPKQEEEKSFFQKILKSVIQWRFGKTNESIVFLPTVSLQVLKHIKKTFPKYSLLVADFDSLQNSYSSQAVNAPIVAQKLAKSHESKDFENYLVERGQADIFFPTNFQFLQFMIAKVLDQRSRVFKAHEFMNEFSKENWTTTKSGYNPLKEDFSNTSFCVTNHE